jgi:hypothetical protein
MAVATTAVAVDVVKAVENAEKAALSGAKAVPNAVKVAVKVAVIARQEETAMVSAASAEIGGSAPPAKAKNVVRLTPRPRPLWPKGHQKS